MPLLDLKDVISRLDNNRAEDAAQMLERHLARHPRHTAAYVLLARAAEEAGHWKEARRRWQRARLLMPNSPAVVEGLRRAARQLYEARLREEGVEIDARGGGRKGEAEGAEAEEAVAAYDDLDRLIDDLDGARIVPHQNLEDVPAPRLDDDIEDVVSETLARIYAAQQQHAEAARVYEKLAEQQPERAEAFRASASDQRARASEEADGQEAPDEAQGA